MLIIELALLEISNNLTLLWISSISCPKFAYRSKPPDSDYL